MNRLTSVNTYKGLNAQTNNWNAIAIDDYGEEISYDPNGNIQTYKRNGSAGKLDMDKMTYQYPKDINGKIVNNRLRYVHDEVNAGNYAEDIDSQTPLTLAQVKAEKLPEQQSDNYVYDAIGNLIQDKKEGINTINWNVYGKIENIVKANTAINYIYDASGNRISKTISNNQPIKQSTFYVRDASGNVMSTYTVDAKINNGNLTQNEVHLYGSSRLGIDEVNRDVQKIGKADYLNKLNTFVVGGVRYELSNHLGNVLATVSDKKIGVDENADGIIDYYNADVITANDYAPFGAALPGKSYNAEGMIHGMNGQMKDKAIDANGDHYTALYWEYDGETGRRWNLDPKGNPSVSPYATFNNNPIWFSDPFGDTSRYPYMGSISKFKYNGSISDNPVENIPNAIGNGVINVLNIVPALWNSGVKNYQGIKEGTWAKDVSSELKSGFNNTSDAVANTIDYTIQTPIKQQAKDYVNTLNSPQTLEMATTFVATFYGPKILSNANQAAATTYLQYSGDIGTFSQVDGFSLRLFNKDFVYHNSQKAASNSRWSSPTSFSSSKEAFNALALDYKNTTNFAQQKFSTKNFGLFIKGTAAPQGATRGGGSQILSTPFGFKTSLTYTGW